jgi:hypothetical protein
MLEEVSTPPARRDGEHAGKKNGARAPGVYLRGFQPACLRAAALLANLFNTGDGQGFTGSALFQSTRGL